MENVGALKPIEESLTNEGQGLVDKHPSQPPHFSEEKFEDVFFLVSQRVPNSRESGFPQWPPLIPVPLLNVFPFFISSLLLQYASWDLHPNDLLISGPDFGMIQAKTNTILAMDFLL